MSLLEHYRTLGLEVGAGIADVTSSYKKLCLIYHPDVSKNPASEEQMKKINIAYNVLREKLRREAAFRERQANARTARRYNGTVTRDVGSPGTGARDSGAHGGAGARDPGARGARGAGARDAGVRGAQCADADREAYSVLNRYFKAIREFDYSIAYNCLSNFDKRQITRESFIEWRKSVARLYTMRDFKISPGFAEATVSWGEGKTVSARKFKVAVTEEDLSSDSAKLGDLEKLVIDENGVWRVFLGYRGVGELTQAFDERFETKRKSEIAKRWEEYYSGLHPEYNMLSLTGMRKTVSREIYRQRRFGGALTFAAFSVRASGNGQDELLRTAARTICGALRETDTPAYAGDGVFAILFIELRKKNAQDIIGRLADKIRKNAGQQLGARAFIEYEFETWSGNSCADLEALNKILKKFRKKM